MDPAETAGGPMIPPSTKVAPDEVRLSPIRRAVCGATALASMKMPWKCNRPTVVATSAAEAGGQTETTTFAPCSATGSDSTSVSPALAARSLVAGLRPSLTHLTWWPAAINALPIDAPMAPGCSKTIVCIRSFWQAAFSDRGSSTMLL